MSGVTLSHTRITTSALLPEPVAVALHENTPQGLRPLLPYTSAERVVLADGETTVKQELERIEGRINSAPGVWEDLTTHKATNANTTQAGHVRLGTEAEQSAGTLNTVAVTPKGLRTTLSALPSDVISGAILMFSGAFVGKNPIPKGSTKADTSWVLCDGTNGTPNLSGRFVLASGGTYTVGKTGGSGTATASGTTGATTLSTAQMPSHGHQMNTGEGTGNNTNISTAETGYRVYTTSYAGGSGAHVHPMTSTAFSTLPPYYVLAFIMKS